MSADLIIAGLQLGWTALCSATMPETWGQDMDVPDSILNFSGGSPFGFVCAMDDAGDQAASMLTPGATISGCPA